MRPTVCYVATYDAGYSRNVDVIRALRGAGVRVEVVRGPERVGRLTAGRSRLRIAWAVLWFVVATVVRPVDVALRLLRCRVLVVGYFGQFDMLLLAPVARALSRPVIFNPLVTLSDTIVEDRKLVAAGSPLARLVRRIDRWSLRLADLVLVDTPENGEYVTALAGLDRCRTLVVPVGVDERVFYPRTEGGETEGGRLDVLFYGTFIPLHGVDTIIQAAAILARERPGIRFELIGTGQEYSDARDLANAVEATNIRWRDWLPYSGLGGRLREADVALGIFDGGEKAARVIPNKVHQALASGVAVVTRDSPAARRLLDDSQSALLVPPDDPRALADAICTLADEPERRQVIAQRGRHVWERHASDERLVEIAGAALRRTGIVP